MTKRSKEQLFADCIYHLVLSRSGMKFTQIMQKVNHTSIFRGHIKEMEARGLIAHIPHGVHGFWIFTKEGLDFMIKIKRISL